MRGAEDWDSCAGKRTGSYYSATCQGDAGAARVRDSRALRTRGHGLPDPVRTRLKEALLAFSYSYTSGRTHNFYHYPARFSPDIVRCVIENFSRPGDVIMDPFMGGGTSVIEGLTAGRRVIGCDVNSL